jgi:hypothetical protein
LARLLQRLLPVRPRRHRRQLGSELVGDAQPLSTRYHGSARNQWLNLAIPWRRTHLLGIPMIVGEWGVRNDDVRNHVYNEQMEEIFRRHGISWARWDLDCVSTFGLVSHGRLNEQGRSLATEILGPG